MKVLPFKIPKPDFEALVFQEDKGPLFFDKLHQHEEIQVSLIVEGEGTLIVGDTINYYSSGDILVIGSKLPHVFKSDVSAEKEAYMISLFFTESSFGLHFFNLEELKELQPFFKRAKHGFKATSHKTLMRDYFKQLESASKLKRFIVLLELLQLLSKSAYTSLSAFIYNKTFTTVEGNRMRDVFEYTMNNYDQPISLEHISSVANMTKTAFCKYFKKRTNKTYITFLNELRVEHACRLLQSSQDLSIAAIAELSGFQNISNFNRQFKAVKLVNPSKFKASKTATIF
ncbi:helix-turn-helix domain-containing protein [Psychroserpens algicola]|uniref:helix-turn-helix domain-containing protein n=1 Tax=Psychroserpens algicola TaxID=1719034 RepID=UPI001954239E